MGWCCVPWCHSDQELQRESVNSGDNINVELAEEADEQFVFLEQFPTDKRVENPNVPFVGELPVPIDVGRVIEIEGEVLPNATRFSVNLACGTSATTDVGLHINPRFDQNHVVRNSRLAGRWGQEECTSTQRNPFHRGTRFYLIILATNEGFMLAVNGKHFCTYSYRAMRLRIQTVQIHGDVVVKSLDYRMTEQYPEIRPDMEDPAIVLSPTTPLLYSITDNVKLPLLGNLPMGLLIGQELEIIGRTKLLPHSFYVNLQNAPHIWPHPDITLHINPRFQADVHGVILNSWCKGQWGDQQKFPLLFTPGRPFSMKVACKRDEYSVTVDGATLGSYRYRFSPHSVNTLYIQGDVLIKEITVR